MNKEDIKVGARVICRYADDPLLHGRIGTISQVNWCGSGALDGYFVEDDKGNRIGSGCGWGLPSSWDLLEEDAPSISDLLMEPL